MFMHTPGDMLAQHITNVDTIAAAGARVPADWSRIRARYDQIAAVPEGDGLERLVAAITTDTTPLDAARLADLMWRAQINAVLTSSIGAEVQGRIHTAVDSLVLTALVNAYAPAAASNYATIATRYNAMGAEFTTAWRKSEGNLLDPAEVVAKPKPVQDAWLKVPALEAQLHGELALLATAARLAGLDVVANVANLAPLGLDTGWMRLKMLEDVWETQDRGGRWGKVLDRKGTTIRAAALSEWEVMDDATGRGALVDRSGAVSRASLV